MTHRDSFDSKLHSARPVQRPRRGEVMVARDKPVERRRERSVEGAQPPRLAVSSAGDAAAQTTQ